MCLCGLEATGEDKHTQSTFHQQQQQLCPCLSLPSLPSLSLFLFLQLFFLMTLILSIHTVISYSLHLPVSPANSFKLHPQLIHLCLFFYFSLQEESNHRIYHSNFSAIHFTVTMARSSSPPALLPLNFFASLLLTLSPFTVGCDHIYWTMITPLIVFLFFLVFVFSLPPSLLQGGSRLLRQLSGEIACYRGSIFHALVNCFVLTLCQSGVVTPAWATRNPVDALMISGCFHQD